MLDENLVLCILFTIFVGFIFTIARYSTEEEGKYTPEPEPKPQSEPEMTVTEMQLEVMKIYAAWHEGIKFEGQDVYDYYQEPANKEVLLANGSTTPTYIQLDHCHPCTAVKHRSNALCYKCSNFYQYSRYFNRPAYQGKTIDYSDIYYPSKELLNKQEPDILETIQGLK